MLIETLTQFFANPKTYAIWLSFLMGLVILWDLKRYLIPNWINGLVLLSFVPAAYFLQLPAMESGIAMSFMLAISMVLFALGIIGGGDAKLLTTLTLWTGYHSASFTLLVYMALLGGVFVLVLWGLRRVMGFFWRRDLPVLFTKGAPVPYGVPIAVAFLLMLWQNRVPSIGL